MAEHEHKHKHTDQNFSDVLNVLATNKTDIEKQEELSRLNLPFAATVATAVPWVLQNSPVDVSTIVEYPVCPAKACLLFWKEHVHAVTCTVCGASRYNADGKDASVFPYIPLIPRIKRLYASPIWSQIIQDQFARPSTEDHFSDVADGDLFKDVMQQVNYSKYTIPFFFGVDGITMDANKEHSVDPLALVNLFLPPEMRTKSAHTINCGITPPNVGNIKVFLQPLLEEISKEFFVFDALTKQRHACNPILLFGTFDMRGLPKATMGNQPPAKLMCHECFFKGMWCTAAATTVYMGHYVYLSQTQVSTRQRCHDAMLPDCKLPPNTPPPSKRTRESNHDAGVLADASELSPDHKNHPCKANFMQASDYFGTYLPYWDPVKCLCVDPMHCFKNKGVDWAVLTVGKKGSKKEKRMKEKDEQFTKRTKLPAKSYQLSEEECKFVNESCQSHRLPR